MCFIYGLSNQILIPLTAFAATLQHGIGPLPRLSPDYLSSLPHQSFSTCSLHSNQLPRFYRPSSKLVT